MTNHPNLPPIASQISPSHSHTHSKLTVAAHSALLEAAEHEPLTEDARRQAFQATAQVYATLEVAAQTARLADALENLAHPDGLKVLLQQ